jgi:hypothetical protein
MVSRIVYVGRFIFVENAIYQHLPYLNLLISARILIWNKLKLKPSVKISSSKLLKRLLFFEIQIGIVISAL